MRSIIKKILRESDFDWVTDIPETYGYRFFEINTCYHYSEDEHTGEDVCTEGGSHFIKIPIDVVPDIWDYEAEDGYIAGPVDEGYDVIVWSLENDKLDGEDYDDIEYVTELTKDEFCRAWGNHQNGDKELCGNLNESDFDWALDKEYSEEEEYVINLMNSCNKEPYKNGFSYEKDGKYYFYQDDENKTFNYSYENVSSVLNPKFGLTPSEVSKLFKDVLKKHHNLKGYKTCIPHWESVIIYL